MQISVILSGSEVRERESKDPGCWYRVPCRRQMPTMAHARAHSALNGRSCVRHNRQGRAGTNAKVLRLSLADSLPLRMTEGFAWQRIPTNLKS